MKLFNMSVVVVSDQTEFDFNQIGGLPQLTFDTWTATVAYRDLDYVYRL